MSPQLATANSVPAPPGGVEFQIGQNGYYTIVEDGDRRIAEGYASVVGLDYQFDEVLPEAFASGAKEYLKKNPVILWDHIRRFPIGRVLKLEVVPGKGLWVRFEVLKGSDIVSPLEKGYPDNSGPVDFPNLKGDAKKQAMISVAKVADETWNLIKLGIARGLSVRGFVRKYWRRWVAELKKFVEVSLEVIITEISVTPIQVHPGAVIQGVAHMSKALEICKAMPAFVPNPPNHEVAIMKLTDEQKAKLTPGQLAIYENMVALRKSMVDAGSGTELPEFMLDGFKEIQKAVKVDEPGENGNQKPADQVVPPETVHPDLSKAIEKAMAPIMQRVEEIGGQVANLSGEKAPRIGHVAFENPNGGQVKPTDATMADEPIKVIEKGLTLLSNSEDGRFQDGQGPFHGCSSVTTMKYAMLRNRFRTDIPDVEKIRLGNGISFTQRENQFHQALISGELDKYLPPIKQGIYA